MSAARVAVVTGSRAEFGLLTPVMRAVEAREDLELLVIVAGSHLVPPALGAREVSRVFAVTDSVPMQIAGRRTRLDDAEALGRGVSRFARSLGGHRPDWVVVLGDRIEALAAASAASVGGIAVAHIHGGDRAEGVADEGMRHAITKLSHLHLVATARSRERVLRMGERADRVILVGSPAIDGLDRVEPLDDAGARELGDPDTVVLMHPIGRPDDEEERFARAVLSAVSDRRVLALEPNLDPGRDGIVRALSGAGVRVEGSMPRARFVSLMARLARREGVLVGNSSAALIECAAIGLPAVDVGVRQGGRERGANVVGVESEERGAIAAGMARALRLDRAALRAGGHPYGDGRAGERIAEALARVDPRDPSLLRKRFVDAGERD